MASQKRKQPHDPFQWLLRKEGEAYDQMLGQFGNLAYPRNGVSWLAVDAWGHLALFDSRGNGNTPTSVFKNSKADHLQLYEYFVRPSEEQMTGDLEVDAPRLGLYFYDIVDYYARPVLMAGHVATDPYYRLAIPKTPLQFAQCPDDIQSLLQVAHFGLFSETPKLYVHKHWDVV